MKEQIDNLNEALRQLEPYHDTTTNAIKALSALVLAAYLPVDKKPQNPAEAPKPQTP
jgi:hypothetical protein